MFSTVDYDVALEVAYHEAVVRQAYRNPGDVWTWSVGLTSATGHDVERYINNPQSLEKCLAVYAWALNNYADDVRSKFKGYPLTKAQFAASVSFHWNTGAIRTASWVNLLMQGASDAKVRAAFMMYDKPASIIERREKEADLLIDGKWSNDGKIKEYTKVKAGGGIDWGQYRRFDARDYLGPAFAAATPAQPVVQTPVPVPVGNAAHTAIDDITARLAALREMV